MADYIDRKLAKRLFANDHDYGLAKRLDEVPAADVMEVVHGRWHEETAVGFSKSFHTIFVCSECEKRYSIPEMNYCPNCGAKMDEVEE